MNRQASRGASRLLGSLLTVGTMCAAALAAQPHSEVESVYGVALDGPQIVFAVESRGCTSAEDFDFQEKDEHWLLTRHAADRCRRKPHLVTITIVFDHAQHTMPLKNPVLLGKP